MFWSCSGGRGQRRPAALVLVAAAVCLSGCKPPKPPLISFKAETVIQTDGKTTRTVRITATPAKGQDPAALELTAFLRLPPEKEYSRFDAGARYASFSGSFDSPAAMPVDFIKKTADVGLLAQNRLRVRREDYALLTTFEIEERVEDVVERAEADEAMSQTVALLTEALLSGLEAEYGVDYALDAFKEWVRDALRELVERLYQTVWEIRRSRRGGLDAESELREFDRRLRQEVSRHGLYLAPLLDPLLGTPVWTKLNDKRAWAFLDAKLAELVTSRRDDAPPLTSDVFRKSDARKRLYANIVVEVEKAFGGLDEFQQQVNQSLALVFGSFFEWRLQLVQSGPVFSFFLRLRPPGRVVQTNGMLDVDGSIFWRFTGDQLQLTGHSMWTRTVYTDEAASRRLGLKGFPGNMTTVERFCKAMRARDGGPDPALTLLLLYCVRDGNLNALREAAVLAPEGPARPKGEGPLELTVSPERAQALLGVISAFCRPDANQSEAQRPPVRIAAAEPARPVASVAPQPDVPAPPRIELLPQLEDELLEPVLDTPRLDPLPPPGIGPGALPPDEALGADPDLEPEPGPEEPPQRP